jgi:hypothetical protein
MMNKYREYRVVLPMRISTSKNKKTALNLNVYRNLHYRKLSKLKINFSNLMRDLLKNIPPLGKVRLHYSICPRTRGLLDISNVGSIVDKFFSDSLSDHGIIEDDNYKYLDHVSFSFGGICNTEHVLVTITEIEPRNNIPMRILLDQTDIQTALDTFVETQGINGTTGVELSVDQSGQIIAEVMIGNQPTKETKTRKKRTYTKKKENNVDVDVPSEDCDYSNSTGSTEPTEGKESKTSNNSEKRHEDSESKNLFGGSQEESSNKKTEEEKSSDKPKKSLIFDLDE